MKQPFYTKFVDENKMRFIFCKKEQNRYWEYTAGLFFFSEATFTFPTLVGYNVTNYFGLLMFVFEILSFVLLIHFSVKFISLDSRHYVFRRKRYLYIFVGGYLLLGLVLATTAGFTTKSISYSESSFEITFNILPYILIYAPSFLTFAIFSHYAFTKLFAKVYNENASILEKKKNKMKNK